jgi:D-alanyl-D-alanine carboxypeptidase
MFGVSADRPVEEPVMNTRFVLIAVALVSTSAFAADAPKAPVERAAQPQAEPAQVVLASADAMRPAPAADQQSAPPAKPARVARVTTCRCGGQEADADADAQPEQ